MDSTRIVVDRRPSLGHARIHEGRHHHPARIKSEHMRWIVAPLGVGGARRGGVTSLLPVLHLVHWLLNVVEKQGIRTSTETENVSIYMDGRRCFLSQDGFIWS